MPILTYRAAALRDLADIAAYIERESQSRARADDFIDRLTGHCEHIASLSPQMGRDRSELRPGYRSVVFGNYIIFLRYADIDSPRSHIYIVNIIHGRRDLDAYFDDQTDDDV